jgi:hypothetical protein
MGQNTFYPFFQAPYEYFGGIIRAIFGRGGGKFKPFNNNYYPVNQKEILIDTSPGSLMNVAMNIPHLNTVISTGAELFSLMKIRHVDKAGEEIENSEVLKFLDKPNPLQTMDQYLYEFYVLNSVYSKTFQNKIQKLSFEKIPSAMWVLPSGMMRINATGKIYRQSRIEDIIVNYEMIGESQPFEVSSVIYMAEGIGHTPLNPVSRIEALQIPLSNIIAALKSYNIIITERGMIGFLSPDVGSKDSDGMIPFDSKEADRFREEYQRKYSLDSSGHVALTTNSMKWVPMTFPTSDLMLFEGMEEAFASICAAFRHDRDMYPSVKGATFENKSAGQRMTIQNALQPLADKLMEQLTYHLIEKPGEKLIACYDHLPCMQVDELKKAQTKLSKIQGLSLALRDNVIDAESYAIEIDMEMTGTGEAPLSTGSINLPSDSLGKIPLAIQQLALARERANTAGDTALSDQLKDAMDKLIEQLLTESIQN